MKTLKNQRSGQVMVLMALFITTLIIMFGMVVSVGHLVQSKINLQNSVDLAAMSGASWQARYLNGFSEVNYRMRQNHKYFLFDTYVTQSRFNRVWQDEVLGGGGENVAEDPSLVFAVCQQAYGYSPQSSIGEPGGSIGESDMCRNVQGGGVFSRIPPIVPSPFPSLNPFYIAVNLAITRLAERFNQICTESAGQNRAWITWATDQLYDRQIFQSQMMESVGQNFSNSFARIAPGDPIGGGTDADSAILSTFNFNLIGSNRENGPRIMWLNNHDARATSGGINGYLIPSTTPVTVTYINFRNSGGCVVEPEVYSANDIIPVGFSMRQNDFAPPQSFHTALAGVANPNILFWPSSFVPTLAAVGAAKPFGSRIAPPQSYYEEEVTRIGGADMANISFFPGDTADNVSGFPGMGAKQVLREAVGRLPSPSRGENALRPKDLDAFGSLAYAPNIFESVYFNAFVGNNVFRPPLGGRIMAGIQSLDPSSYALDDRGGSLPSHDVIPEETLGRYYQPGLTASSWAPPSESLQSGGLGRHGYQIKLISILDVCREMAQSNRIIPTTLTALCSQGVQH